MNCVSIEYSRLLSGGRIERIAQPGKNEIILHARSLGKNYRLLISVLPQEARTHLITATPPNPDQPPVFCMLLRKHLEGGKIVSFEQQGMDRVLYINISAYDELGDLRDKRLIVEIMGKHSNLILIDPQTGIIIDSLKRITEAVNRYRQVLPGELYIPPPASGKYPLWDEREDAIAERLLKFGSSQALDKVILAAYDGLGPLSAQELIHRAGKSPVDTLELFGQRDYFRLYEAVSGLGELVSAGLYQPEILYINGKPGDFSAIPLTLYPNEKRQSYDSINDMLDAYFHDRSVINQFKQRQRDLELIIRREQERCRKKAGLQADSIREGQEARKWQVFGQLLTAYSYKLSQGPSALVPDYNDPDGTEVSIPMDPRLTPMENAQAYFRRYQKARLTAEKARLHYEETMEELAYLESLEFALASAANLSELTEIRQELREARYIKSAEKAEGISGKKTKKAPAPADSPNIGRLSYMGFDILYGNNNKQNDYLTMKIAKSGDLWFHARNIPSSHVIIRNPEKKQIPDKVIEAAAKLCLWRSGARGSGRAPIDFTQRQNVWKPKGARPGMTLYERYQTLYVTVDEDEIKSLFSSYRA